MKNSLSYLFILALLAFISCETLEDTFGGNDEEVDPEANNFFEFVVDDELYVAESKSLNDRDDDRFDVRADHDYVADNGNEVSNLYLFEMDNDVSVNDTLKFTQDDTDLIDPHFVIRDPERPTVSLGANLISGWVYLSKNDESEVTGTFEVSYLHRYTEDTVYLTEGSFYFVKIIR